MRYEVSNFSKRVSVYLHVCVWMCVDLCGCVHTSSSELHVHC